MFRWYKGQITTAVGKSGTAVTGYVAKVHSPNVVTKKEIVRALAYDMSIEEAEAELFIDEFMNQLVEALGSGMGVKLDGFGSFTSTLKTISADTADAVTTDNIVKMNVNFRPSKDFQNQIDNLKVKEATDLRIKHIK